MADVFTKEVRSKVMSRIRSKNTSPEILLRKTLWKKGYRYRIHYKLPGKPDIVFVQKRVAVFVDGCFWHKCPKCYKPPKTNKKYWLPKIEKNVDKDKKNNKKLKEADWKVIRLWEHEVKKDINECIERIEKQLS
jgi:DNA mismatch endonuclease (patch repair protein)